jgi:hypothetical protein
MSAWEVIATERRRLYSPVGLRLVDDFTGVAPIGAVNAFLDVRTVAGAWEETEVSAVRTLSDVLVYPRLGRSAHAATAPIVRYRVRVEALFYRPDYLVNLDAVEFDVHPYDDDVAPAQFAKQPQNLFLIPATNYPFPGHVRVLRGRVVDAGGVAISNVEVTESTQERVLSDTRGGFALPLRWPALNAAVQIDALDHRTGRSGQLSINLPADLAVGHVVTIN